MGELILQPNLEGADDVYERLVRLHEGLSEAESLKVWAKLALTLANHIGDGAVIEQAILVARPRVGDPGRRV
jgi:hypothetical protein